MSETTQTLTPFEAITGSANEAVMGFAPDHILDSNIFNAIKKDYEKPSLFLGEQMGLLDTIHVHYPELTELQDRLQEMNWKHNEFPFESCNVQFKTCDPGTYQVMIRTLAWQWEADSIAARTLLAVMAPFISATELLGVWGEISRNEFLHSRTYSHIVKSSFDDPEVALKEILEVKESMWRAHTVSRIMGQTYQISHKYALGLIEKDDPIIYDTIFLFVVALWCLEGVQFASSFGVTFIVAENGDFVPIGRTVQKICQDELVIHVATCRKILEIELQTPRGIQTYLRLRDTVKTIIDEVRDTELAWNQNLLSEGRELYNKKTNTKITPEHLNGHTLVQCRPIYDFFGLPYGCTIPEVSPLDYLKEWFDINLVKGAPQEEKQGNYLMGGLVRDDHREIYNVNF